MFFEDKFFSIWFYGAVQLIVQLCIILFVLFKRYYKSYLFWTFSFLFRQNCWEKSGIAIVLSMKNNLRIKWKRNSWY
jgi:hypothetical protein